MGPTWQWAWEYGIGNRKLCWLHFMRGGVDVTFTLSDSEEGRLSKGPKIAGALARAILEGQRTGPVKWCWLELADRRAVDAFLSLARRKAEWLGERPALRRRRERRAAAPGMKSKPTELVGLATQSGCVIECADYTSRALTRLEDVVCTRASESFHEQGSSSAVR